MKGLRFWIVAPLTLLVCYAPYAAQEQEPLRPEWLAQDYRSVELISLLASPTPLTVQAIRDILQVGDDGEEEDLGFGASTFEIVRGLGINPTTRIRDVIESLEARVEFPNLRRYVNEDRIDLARLFKIRRKGKKFRPGCKQRRNETAMQHREATSMRTKDSLARGRVCARSRAPVRRPSGLDSRKEILIC